MHCQNCGHENPEGRRHCEECGEKLVDIEALRARARRRSQREAARYRREAEKEGLDTEEAERRRRRTRKRTSPWIGLILLIVVVAVTVVIVILVTMGGESAPQKAVKAFYASINNKDVMEYLKYTNPDLYKMAKSGEYQPDPYAEGIDYDSYRLENLSTRLVKEEGDYAEVEVNAGYFEGFYNDGSSSGGVDFAQHPRLVVLVKIEDTWTIRDFNLMKLPYPLPEIVEDQPEFPEVEESS